MKITKEQDNLINFIKHQINLNLNDYVDLENTTKKYINIYGLNKNQLFNLKNLSLYNNFIVADNGGLGYALIIKKEVIKE